MAAAADPNRILVVVACDEVHDSTWAGIAGAASPGELRVVVPADEGGPDIINERRRLLDASLNLLVELEAAATGTIGPKGADALDAADEELADWPADEAMVLIGPDEDTVEWEHAVAVHPLLRHGAPVVVRTGADPEATAA